MSPVLVAMGVALLALGVVVWLQHFDNRQLRDRVTNLRRSVAWREDDKDGDL